MGQPTERTGRCADWSAVWLLLDLLGGGDCRQPEALPQSTNTKVVSSEPWAAGTESREVCSGPELAWILPLDALLTHKIMPTGQQQAI